MKVETPILAAALLLTACAPAPLTDQTYRAGKGDVATVATPAKQPRAWDCPHRVEAAKHCRERTERERPAPTPPTRPEPPTKPEPEPEKPTPPKEPPAKPAKPEKPKGNASANNGKGGNYDRTDHADNGKGKGRDKK